MLCSAVPLYGSQALQRKDSAISVNIIGLVGLQGFFLIIMIIFLMTTIAKYTPSYYPWLHFFFCSTEIGLQHFLFLQVCGPIITQ